VAGTEFVIGALFVSWGATARDIFLGLLLGNLMAVLTWAFVCAPIATQTRLTLYWYLRRIAGPVTTTIYNILNAILFCILAGCMITVSASAIRIPFGIPEQTQWYPNDIRFVLVFWWGHCYAGILGFKRLAQFAEVCSPWISYVCLGRL
jgi:NCS1 family nucleobase:cation symporter-1